MRLSKGSLAVAALATVGSAWADPSVHLGQPTFHGSGCDSGSASATLSPDASALSVIFDRFAAEAGRGASVRADRMMCNMTLPMEVPAGYSVTVTRVDYRGFNSLPAGAQSTFTAKFGVKFATVERDSRDLVERFNGPVDDEFLLSHTLDMQTWSQCGGEVQLSLSAFLQLQSNAAGEFAMMSMDSVDMTSSRAEATYILQWRQCSVGPTPPPRPPLPPGPRPPRPPGPPRPPVFGPPAPFPGRPIFGGIGGSIPPR